MAEFHYLKRFTFPWGLSIRCQVMGRTETNHYEPCFNKEENYDKFLPKLIPWRDK